MTIQIRPQGGGLPYAPFRDITNFFPSLARQAVYCLAEEYREPELSAYMDRTGVTESDLGEAAKALAEFINRCREPELGSPEQVADASGITRLPAAAQLAMLAKLGQVTLAMYYASSRDALRVDEKPLALDALLDTAEQVSKELHKARL